MRKNLLLILIAAVLLSLLPACSEDSGEAGGVPIAFTTQSEMAIEVGQRAEYVLSGLDDRQAYRITLVVDANVTASGDSSGVFIDEDANGTADAGASEAIAVISAVNGESAGDVKTVPDAANPAGVFPSGGEIRLSIEGVAAGKVYPVAYENGGASTFLEVNDRGEPTEIYTVGGALTVGGASVIDPTVVPATERMVSANGAALYTITGLRDTQAYRITLVVDDNVTLTSGGMGTFVDNDANGAADAGASEAIALITSINGEDIADGGSKTVPGGGDDPASPSGIFPVGGEIALEVTGVAAGKVHPVVYENGGASTFLEVNGSGAPTEVYTIGGALSVMGNGSPAVNPAAEQALEVDDSITYLATGLLNSQAYRVTLVVDGNITLLGEGAATFVDGDANGAADAGASEAVALITTVNGVAVGGTKTVPGGDDDPASPSGVFPDNGAISVTVRGVAAGKVHPVFYENGGASTFLEIDGDGAPVETYTVGGAVTVAGGQITSPTVSPTTDQTVAVGAVSTYVVEGLDDAQAYRVTLVIGDNITAPGDGTGTFVDGDANGAADAGASETVALITEVNGIPVSTKTVPDGADDPMDPTGVFPTNGRIELDITGVGAGVIYPVAYENGGASTFLEVDGGGVPSEVYSVGGAVTVE